MKELGYAVIGLGYVGLPVALALARAFVLAMPAPGGVLVDLKAAIDRARVPRDVPYWTL